MIDSTNYLQAQHYEYCLHMAKEEVAAALLQLLCEPQCILTLVPPACVSGHLPPPTINNKYIFATAQIIGHGKKGS
eukprot:9180637-Ditylum_brightwellii.AAC.1